MAFLIIFAQKKLKKKFTPRSGFEPTISYLLESISLFQQKLREIDVFKNKS